MSRYTLIGASYNLSPIGEDGNKEICSLIQSEYLSEVRRHFLTSHPNSKIAEGVLLHLEDEFYEMHATLQCYLSSALAVYPQKVQMSVLKSLQSEDITIQSLLGSDICDARDVLSKFDFKGGVLLTLLSAIRESQSLLNQTWIDWKGKEMDTVKGEGVTVNPLLKSDYDRSEISEEEEDLLEEGESSGQKVPKKERIDVFISYSWATKDICRKIRDLCVSADLRCWFDEGEMAGGDDLFAKIDKGIRESSVVLACVSPGTFDCFYLDILWVF